MIHVASYLPEITVGRHQIADQPQLFATWVPGDVLALTYAEEARDYWLTVMMEDLLLWEPKDEIALPQFIS